MTKNKLDYLKAFIPCLIILSFFIWIAVNNISYIVGLNFPKESELQYDTGILTTYEQTFSYKTGQNTPVMVRLSGNYFCNYHVGHKPAWSNCLKDKQELLSYSGQKAKIGWYKNEDFLWIKNPYKQLVTLEVNSKVVLSYQDTKAKVDKKRGFDIIFYPLLSIFMFLVCAISCLPFLSIVYPIEKLFKRDQL